MTRPTGQDGAANDAAEALSCVALRARRLSRLVTRLYERALSGHDITIAQFTLLGAAVLEGPLKPARLARLLDLEKSTLSRNLRLMEAAGLLRIVSDGTGPAGHLVHVTGRGRRTLAGALPAWREAQRRVTDALGAGVVGELDTMLSRLGAARVRGGRSWASEGSRSRRQRRRSEARSESATRIRRPMAPVVSSADLAAPRGSRWVSPRLTSPEGRGG